MLIAPPLAPKSPSLGPLFHAEHGQWSFVLLPLSASGLSMADSQAGGRAVPAQVSQAPALSLSCCFPPGAPRGGGDLLLVTRGDAASPEVSPNGQR